MCMLICVFECLSVHPCVVVLVDVRVCCGCDRVYVCVCQEVGRDEGVS